MSASHQQRTFASGSVGMSAFAQKPAVRWRGEARACRAFPTRPSLLKWMTTQEA
jgi:hypothetical protein